MTKCTFCGLDMSQGLIIGAPLNYCPFCGKKILGKKKSSKQYKLCFRDGTEYKGYTSYREAYSAMLTVGMNKFKHCLDIASDENEGIGLYSKHIEEQCDKFLKGCQIKAPDERHWIRIRNYGIEVGDRYLDIDEEWPAVFRDENGDDFVDLDYYTFYRIQIVEE